MKLLLTIKHGQGLGVDFKQSWLTLFCQTPYLGQGLGVDFTRGLKSGTKT